MFWWDSLLLVPEMTIIVFQVKEIAPSARRRNAKLSFAFVYPDKGGRFVLKQVLACVIDFRFSKKSKQDELMR